MAEGFLDFTAGSVLTAAQVDDYLMRQANMRFASAAARDSALASVLTEGLVAVLEDVDQVTVYSGSAWVVAYHYGAWSTYTPTMFQQDGTGQTLTVNTARFCRQGRMISGTNILTVSAAGSATNGEPIIVSMPVAPLDLSNFERVGVGFIHDSGTANYPVFVVNVGGSFQFCRSDTSTITHAGVDPAFALAAGDVVSFNYQYEAA